jgi:hypothetical protein
VSEPFPAGRAGPGLKLAIVGSQSRYLAPWHLELVVRLIERVLDEYRPGLVISGGSAGVERLAAARARRRGIAVVEPPPRGDGRAMDRERGLRIARDCDRLVRILVPDGPSRESGWTRDRAREMGKPVEEYVIGRPATYLKRVESI